MTYMFYGATSFNGQIGNWNVSKITGLHLVPFRRARVQSGRQQVGYLAGHELPEHVPGNSVPRRRDSMERCEGDVDVGDVLGITRTVASRFYRGTPWINKILIAWSRQPVRSNVGSTSVTRWVPVSRSTRGARSHWVPIHCV